jgi:hypothetical protein
LEATDYTGFYLLVPLSRYLPVDIQRSSLQNLLFFAGQRLLCMQE